MRRGAHALGACAERRESSSLSIPTRIKLQKYSEFCERVSEQPDPLRSKRDGRVSLSPLEH